MLVTAKKTRAQCWVDVFEQPHFQGRMRRIFGPGEFGAKVAERGKWNVASMIVGPGAAVVCQWRAKPGGDDKWLQPRSVIPDVSRLMNGATLRSIRIIVQREVV
jgi:hypothetical protein